MDSCGYLDYTFTVSSYDIDIWGCLKPTAILNICQDSAYRHACGLGFGYEHLMSKGSAWVLSRARVEIERMPVWLEQVRVRTWHKRQSGIFALRDYIFYDENDVPIIRITTSWLIINIATRRIVRVDRVFEKDSAYKLVDYAHDALEHEAEKVEVGSEQKYIGEHHVRYSDMDVNQHVNNTRYLEWACDLSPQQMDSARCLSRFCINFNHEARFTERVMLSGSMPTSDEMTVEGRIEGRSIFAVNLTYRDRE